MTSRPKIIGKRERPSTFASEAQFHNQGRLSRVLVIVRNTVNDLEAKLLIQVNHGLVTLSSVGEEASKSAAACIRDLPAFQQRAETEPSPGGQDTSCDNVQ